MGGQKHQSTSGDRRLLDPPVSAKLRIRLCIEVDENLRCRQWAVETRQHNGKRLNAVVRPLIDAPFPEAIGQALDEVLSQHRDQFGPFDAPNVPTTPPLLPPGHLGP